VHNVSQWPNLRHLSLGGAEGYVCKVSAVFNRVTYYTSMLYALLRLFPLLIHTLIDDNETKYSQCISGLFIITAVHTMYVFLIHGCCY